MLPPSVILSTIHRKAFFPQKTKPDVEKPETRAMATKTRIHVNTANHSRAGTTLSLWTDCGLLGWLRQLRTTSQIQWEWRYAIELWLRPSSGATSFRGRNPSLGSLTFGEFSDCIQKQSTSSRWQPFLHFQQLLSSLHQAMQAHQQSPTHHATMLPSCIQCLQMHAWIGTQLILQFMRRYIVQNMRTVYWSIWDA